jgi:hypothetical protein
VTVAVALAGSAVLTSAGWGVEMAGLPQPTTTERLVASAEGWLRDYPLATAAFHGGHVQARGICLRTSVRSFVHSRLAITDGPLFGVTQDHARLLRGNTQPGFPAHLASRIGCTAMLLQPVMWAAETRAHVESASAFEARKPAVALTFPRYLGERLVLYVSSENGRPLGAHATLRGVELSATLHLSRPGPPRIARLGRELGITEKTRR